MGGCEVEQPDIDWLLAALQEFQQELRDAQDERVSREHHTQVRQHIKVQLHQAQ